MYVIYVYMYISNVHEIVIAIYYYYTIEPTGHNYFYLCICRNGDKLLLNSSASHLIRSKPACDSEGGNLNGAGALNSVILTN